ncbi:hypothetical protein Lauda_00087 [Pseudomonas phage vB_PpuM-Lauda]
MGTRADAYRQLNKEMSSMVNRRQRLDRTVDLLLDSMGVPEDDIDKIIEDVQKCDFRSLGKVLQGKSPDNPNIEWCLKTHQDYDTVQVDRS